MDPRLAVVTGASSGIGFAVAARLARAGWHVAMLARDPERLAAAVARIQKDATGPDPLGRSVDVADGDVAGVLDSICRRLGPIDALCTCAGVIPPYQEVTALDDDAWTRTIAVNLTGTMRCCRAAWQHLRDGAAVVTIGSVVGPVVGPGIGAYAASKGGVAALTRVLAAEGAARGIRVNTVTPGFIDTPMNARLRAAAPSPNEWWDGNVARIPLGRPGSADEVAAAVAFLLGDEAGFVVGADLRIDGGVSLGAPGWSQSDVTED